jgi:hypothetical protein
MSSLRRITGITGCLLAISMLFPHQAFAYIDPGSGNYMIQMIVAALAGIAYTIKHWWRSIIDFFKRLFSGKK